MGIIGLGGIGAVSTVFRNKKGQLISAKDVKSIKNFYKFYVEIVDRPRSIKKAVAQMELSSLKRVIELGSKASFEFRELR